MKKIVEFKNVSLGYSKKKIFERFSADIMENDFLGVVGPNGSGKSTFLMAIMGMIKPERGKIARARGVRFGYCMQRQFIDSLFPFTVSDMVMMARLVNKPFFKRADNGDIKAVKYSLERAGIAGLEDASFRDLSGGQKQRVLIARALSLEPNFLVLDEPTTDLDVKGEREILELIRSLHNEYRLTIVMVSHELNEVINFPEKFLFLSGSSSCHIIDRSKLTSRVLSDVFGVSMELKELGGKYTVA